MSEPTIQERVDAIIEANGWQDGGLIATASGMKLPLTRELIEDQLFFQIQWEDWWEREGRPGMISTLERQLERTNTGEAS